MNQRREQNQCLPPPDRAMHASKTTFSKSFPRFRQTQPKVIVKPYRLLAL